MLLTVSHTTRYEFTDPVLHGLQRLRLRPKSTHGQDVLDWTMTLEGARIEAEYDDQNHNHVTLVAMEPGAEQVTVTCSGTVRTSDNAGILGPHAGHTPLWCFLRPTKLTRAGNRVRHLVASVDVDKGDTLAFLHALSAAIADEVEYLAGHTDVATTAEQVLEAGRGVCQDHAHVLISAGRLADIPMRYVGGYLKMDDREEQDAGHGWAEGHVAGLGWVGFDVSNRVCPDDRYIRVASGCDYAEAAPVTGIAAGGGRSSLDVRLSVSEKMLGGQQQSSGGAQQ